MGTEIEIFACLVRPDANLKQLSFLSSDNRFHRSADRSGDQNVSRLFVSQDWRTSQDPVAFADQEPRCEALEITRLDSNDVRSSHLPELKGCRSCNRNIQPSPEFDVV